MADEERVRNLAYEIWESEGRPEGQQQRHWDMALKIVAAEQAAGMDAELEEVGEPVAEPPILEDDLPLEDDERGIDENRLPLEPPDGEPDFDELPYRDDRDVAQDVPVQVAPARPQARPNPPQPPPARCRPRRRPVPVPRIRGSPIVAAKRPGKPRRSPARGPWSRYHRGPLRPGVHASRAARAMA